MRGADGCVIRTDPTGLRLATRYAPLPPYPQTLLGRAKRGLVVVALSVNSTGIVRRVSVIESLDEAAAQSVTETVKKWRFASWANSPRGASCPLEGRLVFYFDVVKGKPVVRDAAAERLAFTSKATNRPKRSFEPIRPTQ